MGYNPYGTLTFQYPPGPLEDDYKIKLFVIIVDNSGGSSKYIIDKPIRVVPDMDLIKSLVNDLINENIESSFYGQINSGYLQLCSQNLIALATSLNSFSKVEKSVIDNSNYSNLNSNETTLGPTTTSPTTLATVIFF